MAATIHRLPSASKQHAHMMVAKTNPWLDTVLATEPVRPSTPTQAPKQNGSPKVTKSSDQQGSQLSTSKPKATKKPAESSLDEAFQAAVKAIVPERLEATRIAQAKVGRSSQGTNKDTPKVTSFTQITSGNPKPARKLLSPKTKQLLHTAKEKPLLHTAIEHLTLDRLHTVLYKALNESPKARSVFERELLVPSSLDPVDDKNAVAVAARQITGRKRLRFEKCRWCKEEFDVTRNPDNACNHHTGELVFNKRNQKHDDGVEDGLSDMDEKREHRLSGFTWDCCQVDEDDDGCEITAHGIDDNYDIKRLRRF
jgi:hypothetical protein